MKNTIPIRILMLEDDPVDADLTRRYLKNLDTKTEIIAVNNASDYCLELSRAIPDVILSDFSLPTINGLAAFELQQKICPDIPFIILSGSIGEEKAVELIKNGITDYALKDKIFTLAPKIKRALKEAEEARALKDVKEKFKQQYAQLLEIAWLQSHQVRAPIATIKGLVGMFNQENPADPINSEVVKNLKLTAESFDEIIQKIVLNTAAIDPPPKFL